MIHKSLNHIQGLLEVYKSLFDNNPDASYALDLEGNFVLVNKSTNLITGYTSEELLGMKFLPLFNDDDVGKVIHHFENALKGSQEHFEVKLKQKKGSYVDLIITAFPIVLNNKIEGVIGIAKNVSEKNKIHDELAASKHQLQNIFNSLDIFLWSYDVIHNKTIQVSSACEKIYGISAEEFLSECYGKKIYTRMI